MLPRSVLISPLWATKRYGCASGHDGNVLVEKRWCTSASADSTVGVGQIGKHALDLRGREHALVDQRVGREADDVERLAVRAAERELLDCVLDALADDVERRSNVAGVIAELKFRGMPPVTGADEDLLEDRRDRGGALRRRLARLMGTARQPRTVCPSSIGDAFDERSQLRRGRGRRSARRRGRRRTPRPAAAETAGPCGRTDPASARECRRRRRCPGRSRRRRDVRD